MGYAQKIPTQTEIYQLGGGSEAEQNLIDAGALHNLGNGDYQIDTKEGTENAREGDYFRIDSAGDPYPMSRDYIFGTDTEPAHYRQVDGDTFETVPVPVQTWQFGEEFPDVLRGAVDSGQLQINEDDPEHFLSAEVSWGNIEGNIDSTIIIYGQDENGNADFAFVSSDQFDDPVTGMYEQVPVFINLSNHPSEAWDEKQMDAAQSLGVVFDEPFPSVDPKSTDEEIRDMASSLADRIEREYGIDTTVMCQGQYALVSALNGEFADRGIQTVVGTTEMNVTVNEDGSTTRKFDFVQFRECNTPFERADNFEPKEGGCVVNFSSRGFETWSDEQKEATHELSSDIRDYRSPNVGASETKEDIDERAQNIVNDFVDMGASYAVLGGETSLTYRVSELCAENGIQAFTGMSERISVINEDGSKTAKFEFQGYCKLNNTNDDEEDKATNDNEDDRDDVDIADMADIDNGTDTFTPAEIDNEGTTLSDTQNDAEQNAVNTPVDETEIMNDDITADFDIDDDDYDDPIE